MTAEQKLTALAIGGLLTIGLCATLWYSDLLGQKVTSSPESKSTPTVPAILPTEQPTTPIVLSSTPTLLPTSSLDETNTGKCVDANNLFYWLVGQTTRDGFECIKSKTWLIAGNLNGSGRDIITTVEPKYSEDSYAQGPLLSK